MSTDEEAQVKQLRKRFWISLPIGAWTVEVYFVSNLREIYSCVGLCIVDNALPHAAEIYITTDLAKEGCEDKLMSTLLHECLHAISDISDFPLHERFVLALEQNLMQLLHACIKLPESSRKLLPDIRQWAQAESESLQTAAVAQPQSPEPTPSRL